MGTWKISVLGIFLRYDYNHCKSTIESTSTTGAGCKAKTKRRAVLVGNMTSLLFVILITNHRATALALPGDLHLYKLQLRDAAFKVKETNLRIKGAKDLPYDHKDGG